jgi:hypothetical protein
MRRAPPPPRVARARSPASTGARTERAGTGDRRARSDRGESIRRNLAEPLSVKSACPFRNAGFRSASVPPTICARTGCPTFARWINVGTDDARGATGSSVLERNGDGREGLGTRGVHEGRQRSRARGRGGGDKRRISLAVALLGAVAAGGCSGGGDPSSSGSSRGVPGSTFTALVRHADRIGGLEAPPDHRRVRHRRGRAVRGAPRRHRKDAWRPAGGLICAPRRDSFAASTEACLGCHGVGRIAPIAEAHRQARAAGGLRAAGDGDPGGGPSARAAARSPTVTSCRSRRRTAQSA